MTWDDVNTTQFWNAKQTRWRVSLKGASFVSVERWFDGNVEELTLVQQAAFLLELQAKLTHTIKKLERYKVRPLSAAITQGSGQDLPALAEREVRKVRPSGE